jgi:hypothetical protein
MGPSRIIFLAGCALIGTACASESAQTAPVSSPGPLPAATAPEASCDPTPAPADERVVLERTACFGSCPAYSVEVRRDGTVIYEGSSFVRVRGRVCATIPKSTAAALFDEASRARLSALDHSYRVPITDHPSATVTVQLGGAAPVAVEDYPPCHTEDPATPIVVCKLEASIDRAAGTSAWTTCTAPDGGTSDCPP